MREMRNMLENMRLKDTLNALQIFAECLIASAMMAMGTVGVVLLFAGIGVDMLGVRAFVRFSVVATFIFFAIFMGNFTDKRR